MGSLEVTEEKEQFAQNDFILRNAEGGLGVNSILWISDAAVAGGWMRTLKTAFDFIQVQDIVDLAQEIV